MNTTHTDPKKSDTDKGGVNDGVEVGRGTDPLNKNDDIVKPGDPDDDHDGLTNSKEKYLGTNPKNPDTDGDGLKDGEEYFKYHTNPLKRDTDGGGVNDGYEVKHGKNPLDKRDDRSNDCDADNDGLLGSEEGKYGTDPNDSDTDNDGLSDGAEVKKHHTDPLKKDTDDGGEDDGHEVCRGTHPDRNNDDHSKDHGKHH